MAVLLLVGPAVLPEFRNPAPGRLDLISVGMSLVAALLVVWGLKQVTVEGALGAPFGAIAVGALIGVAFVRRQLKLATPLLDLRLFSNRPFTSMLVALALAGVAMAGAGLLVTQYLQSVLGFTLFWTTSDSWLRRFGEAPLVGLTRHHWTAPLARRLGLSRHHLGTDQRASAFEQSRCGRHRPSPGLAPGPAARKEFDLVHFLISHAGAVAAAMS